MDTKGLSINFHITKFCNMKCKFCFATFNDLKSFKLNENDAKQIITEVANSGFKKITFVGGEPTVVKELKQLLKHAKSKGLVTTIVTNGSLLLVNNLLSNIHMYLDWIAISIDSINDETNRQSGRKFNNTVLTQQFYKELLSKIKSYNINLKINTVVSKYNYKEDISSFIKEVNPERWKILQALYVSGQNNTHKEKYEVTNDEFSHFIQTHKNIITALNDKVVIENTNLIIGSYLMISPDGRFFDDTKGKHTYSQPILDIGIQNAIKQITFNKDKFQERGGIYDYENKKGGHYE